MGRRPGPGLNPKGDVVPNLPALAGTLALQGGEEVRILLEPRVLVFALCSAES